MLWFRERQLPVLRSPCCWWEWGSSTGYGAGLPGIGPGAVVDAFDCLPGYTHGLFATRSFWLANVGLPAWLAGSVLPSGWGWTGSAPLFGFTEAFAGISSAVSLSRALRKG